MHLSVSCELTVWHRAHKWQARAMIRRNKVNRMKIYGMKVVLINNSKLVVGPALTTILVPTSIQPNPTIILLTNQAAAAPRTRLARPTKPSRHCQMRFCPPESDRWSVESSVRLLSGSRCNRQTSIAQAPPPSQTHHEVCSKPCLDRSAHDVNSICAVFNVIT